MGISSITSALSGYSSNSSNKSVTETLLDSLTSNSITSNSDSTSDSDSSSSLMDILDISDEGQSAADSLFDLLEEISFNRIQNSVDTVGNSIQTKLETAFEAAGIDTSSEIDLQLDSDGNVAVSNDNSEAQKIEDAINNDPSLKKAVTEYLQFVQTIAPTLVSGSSDSSSSLTDWVASLKSEAASDGSGTATLIVKGDSFEALYESSGGESQIVSYG
jgi:hypothetical protein